MARKDYSKRKWRVLDNPRITGTTKTIFEDIEYEDTELAEYPSDRELSEYFTEKWKKTVKPFSSYKSFKKYENDYSIIFSIIKNNYIKFVLEKEWSEEKYATVLDEIFKRKSNISEKDIEKWGVVYDRRK